MGEVGGEQKGKGIIYDEVVGVVFNETRTGSHWHVKLPTTLSWILVEDMNAVVQFNSQICLCLMA